MVQQQHQPKVFGCYYWPGVSADVIKRHEALVTIFFTSFSLR